MKKITTLLIATSLTFIFALSTSYAAPTIQRVEDTADQVNSNIPDNHKTIEQYRVVRTRRYYTRNYRPHPVRVYSPAPVVVVRPTPVAVAEPQPVQQPVAQAQNDGKKMGSFGLKGTGLVGTDAKLRTGTFKNNALGGIGAYLRIRPSRFVGVELASDILIRHSPKMDVYKVPVTVAAMAHLLPYGPFEVYGIGALGAYFTTIDLTPGKNDPSISNEKYVQFAGQLGAGASVHYAGIEIFVDGRYVMMQARPEIPDKAFYFRPIDRTSDKLEHGFQFSFGVGFCF